MGAQGYEKEPKIIRGKFMHQSPSVLMNLRYFSKWTKWETGKRLRYFSSLVPCTIPY